MTASGSSPTHQGAVVRKLEGSLTSPRVSRKAMSLMVLNFSIVSDNSCFSQILNPGRGLFLIQSPALTGFFADYCNKELWSRYIMVKGLTGLSPGRLDVHYSLLFIFICRLSVKKTRGAGGGRGFMENFSWEC